VGGFVSVRIQDVMRPTTRDTSGAAVGKRKKLTLNLRGRSRAIRGFATLGNQNPECRFWVKAGKAQSEQISSALPPIATDARTFLIGSSVPTADIIRSA
jgi:hypothetical protein